MAKEHSRRMGRFYIAYDIVMSEKVWPVLAKMKFVPLRVEFLATKNMFEYDGISPMFDPIELGQIIPVYDITVGLEEEVTVSMRRTDL